MSLEKYGIYNSDSHWNLSPSKLAEISINSKHAKETSSGAITVDTGEFTGRSPKDRFVVKDNITSESVWWGDVNIPFEADHFDKLYNKVCKHLENKEVYVRDAYACADSNFKLNIRVINEYPWSNMFAYNMFLRPTEEELIDFQEDWLILNVPSFKADPKVDGTRQHNFAILNFTKKIILIGGTGYTGEIKKGIFSVLNFTLPHNHNVLSMHCSANIGKSGDTAVFFGLSGTGKTTLSADPQRLLIGDDEHGWSDNTVFNFEGGCYAKCIDLSAEKEPDIFNAIKPGALLENVRFKQDSNIVDFENTSVTQNTRVSYPINHINNIATPSIGEAPKNIFFLTCDAFGVLPPISKLDVGQAMYHFISGYTAKIAGTEEGINEPQTTFSACFGAPFLPLHPTKYAELLGEKLKDGNINVWLINTGWSGGQYGEGERISLKYTRAMISAALNGELNNVEYSKDPIFGLNFPKECKGVPTEILEAKNTWSDEKEYDKIANKLARVFINNFNQFEEFANEEILASAPKTKTVAN
jgi:phosphoenolpyruvate carboxykinase (ATP)